MTSMRLLGKDSKKKRRLKPATGAGAGSGCFCCKSNKEDDESLPLTSFQEDDASISYKVECMIENMDSNFWSMGIVSKQELFVRMVTTPPEIWTAHVKLHEKLTDDTINFKFENQFKKLVFTLQKPRFKMWKTIGIVQKDHNKLMDSRAAPVDYYSGTVVLKETMPNSTLLFAIKLGKEVHFGIPVGWHMRFRIEGLLEKSYTPVKLITSQQSEDYDSLDDTAGQVILFIIKIYNDGKTTPLLANLELFKPSSLEIGGIRGSFDTNWLMDLDRLILMGGGTGVTPFMSIIKFIKEKKRDIKVKQVILIQSAVEPAALIWQPTWKTLTKLGWFFYVPYITQSTQSWNGNQGRVTTESIIANLDQIPLPEEANIPLKVKGAACGPWGFTDTCQTIFESIGLPSEDIFMFEG